MPVKKILVINLGSTSSKAAYYEDEACLFGENIEHESAALRSLGGIANQYQYRYDALLDFLKRHNVDPASLDAVVSRGGHTEPLEGGVYRINEKMLEQSNSTNYGYHACDLGLRIAHSMAGAKGGAFTVDPPVTCEFEPLSFYSGLAEIKRKSSLHVLNQRAAARQCASDLGKPYEEARLIGIHMGGGVSVAVHKNGRLVDANNALEGDGPFSTNRTGGLPVGALVELCYSGKYTYQEMRRKLNGEGGLASYIGETDVKTVEERIRAGDAGAAEALAAMCYQTAKEIGACAAALKGDVDAIFFTGGMANSEYVTGLISEYVSFIAPIVKYPGEFEMQALARGAYEALTGAKEIKVF